MKFLSYAMLGLGLSVLAACQTTGDYFAFDRRGVKQAMVDDGETSLSASRFNLNDLFLNPDSFRLKRLHRLNGDVSVEIVIDLDRHPILAIEYAGYKSFSRASLREISDKDEFLGMIRRYHVNQATITNLDYYGVGPYHGYLAKDGDCTYLAMMKALRPFAEVEMGVELMDSYVQAYSCLPVLNLEWSEFARKLALKSN